MPDVSPFRGVRYDVARVGTLSDVVAPPYDVIDPALQDRLYDASPYNVIRLELNREEPGDYRDPDRYTRASRFLKDWLRQGILREEDHAGFLRLPADVRGRGADAHAARGSSHESGWSRSARGRSIPRADPVRPQGRPAGSVQRHRVQPQPDLRTLSRSGGRGAPQRSRRESAIVRRWWRPTTSASRTGSGSSTTRRLTPRSAA